MVTAAIWPALDYSRVPYRLYHDAELYRREQERIFQGPVWNYLGLDAEIVRIHDGAGRVRAGVHGAAAIKKADQHGFNRFAGGSGRGIRGAARSP